MTFGNRKWHFLSSILQSSKDTISALFILLPPLRSYNNFSHTSSFIPFGCIVREEEGTPWWLGSYGYGEDCVGYWLKTVSAPSSDTRVHWGDWTQDSDGTDGIRPGISLSLLPLPPPVTLLTSPCDHLCDILPSSSNCFYIMLMKPGLPLMHQWLMCFLKALCIFSFIIYICFSFELDMNITDKQTFLLARRNALSISKGPLSPLSPVSSYQVTPAEASLVRILVS